MNTHTRAHTQTPAGRVEGQAVGDPEGGGQVDGAVGRVPDHPQDGAVHEGPLGDGPGPHLPQGPDQPVVPRLLDLVVDGVHAQLEGRGLQA